MGSFIKRIHQFLKIIDINCFVNKLNSSNVLLLFLLLWRKEGNSLFNDALNTLYLRLYGVRHMVKDHSDNKRGNLLPPYRLLFPISSKVFLYALSHRQDNTYHSLCYTSRGALDRTGNSSMGPPHEGSIRRLLLWIHITLYALYKQNSKLQKQTMHKQVITSLTIIVC